MPQAFGGWAYMARHTIRFLLFALVVSLVGCDHATKYAAQASLTSGAAELVPNILELRYTENHDTAFSLLAHRTFTHKPLVLAIASTLALAFVVGAWWRRRRGARTEHAAFALVLAGALGNVIDRLAHGYVVDFIHVTYWPVFNVADILVVAGLALFGLHSFRRRRDRGGLLSVP